MFEKSLTATLCHTEDGCFHCGNEFFKCSYRELSLANEVGAELSPRSAARIFM